MASEYYTRGEVALWVQPDGPNTAPVYLGCHQLDSVSEPLGDNTLIRCPDPARPNAYRAIGKVKALPDLVTLAIQFRIQEALDYLETQACPLTIFAHLRKCGRADLFANYDRSFIFQNADITSRGLENLAAMEDNSATVAASADFQADPPVLRVKGVSKIITERQTTTEIRNARDIWFYDSLQCPGCCPKVGPGCRRGYITTAAIIGSAGSVGHVLYTVDGGATWTPTITDPFGAGEDVGAVVAFFTAADTVRVVVARASADAGNPAEIAYSDDNGANWITVNVGATVGEYITNGASMWALDRAHIWAVTSLGNIYFSADGALTWTLQYNTGWSGVARGVHFYDQNCGVVVGTDAAAGAAVYTINGGTSWTDTVTDPGDGDPTDAVWMIDCCHWWVLDNAGELEYTADSGDTWTQRQLPNQSSLDASGPIMFVNPLVGYVAVGDSSLAASRLYRTIDGGYTWEELAIPTNAGLNSLWVCGLNEFYLAGDDVAGTTFIAHGE